MAVMKSPGIAGKMGRSFENKPVQWLVAGMAVSLSIFYGSIGVIGSNSSGKIAANRVQISAQTAARKAPPADAVRNMKPLAEPAADDNYKTTEPSKSPEPANNGNKTDP